MAFSNKTENYDLPQFIADDTPTWLDDFNKAMQIIDRVLKELADKIESK